MVHLLHSPGILSLRACALTDDNRLQLPLSQQFHQRLRLRAELGLGKGPVALFAARRILDAGEMDLELPGPRIAEGLQLSLNAIATALRNSG